MQRRREKNKKEEEIGSVSCLLGAWGLIEKVGEGRHQKKKVVGFLGREWCEGLI